MTPRFRPGEGLAGWVYQNGRSTLVSDAINDPRFAPASESPDRPRSMLVVPVRVGDRTVGVISADKDEPNAFDTNDLRLAETLAQQAGIAIQRSRDLEPAQAEAEAAARGGTATTPRPVPAPPWRYGQCLAGLHGPLDPYPLQDADYAVIRETRVEAVKLLSAGDDAPAAGAASVRRLREINPNLFVMARILARPADRRMAPSDFVMATRGSIHEFYAAGVRYFEVHNEPNLSAEGLGVSWANGAEFSAWFLQVMNMLRADTGLAEARWGFPGCSPGAAIPGQRQAMWAPSGGFMDQCAAAIATADWLGLHCYWQDGAGMHSEIDGMAWRRARARFPGKLLFITEFSNNSPNVPPAEKGRQYA